MVEPGRRRKVRYFGVVSWLAERYADLWDTRTKTFWAAATQVAAFSHCENV